MYQFIHVESYSLSASKSSVGRPKEGLCVSSIVAEATRQPRAIPHIAQPMPPRHIHGRPLEELQGACERWSKSISDARGRKLRKDALCLAAGVISAPDGMTDWDGFKSDAVEWLKRKYGDRLHTVIEHTDEKHPHLHFYAIPRPGERFETVHQGREASALAKANGGLKGQQNQAYKAAMREYNDDFFVQVAMHHGMARIGPGRRRLSREQWKLEQVQAASIATAKVVAEMALAKADEIEKTARERGFQAGIEMTSELPWWQRVKLFVGSAVRERDSLKEQLKAKEDEASGWMSKAKKYLGMGKKIQAELREVRPKLKQTEDALELAQSKASEAVRLRRDAEELREKLSIANGLNEHLRATVESLSDRLDEYEKPAPQVQHNKAPVRGRHYDSESTLG